MWPHRLANFPQCARVLVALTMVVMFTPGVDAALTRGPYLQTGTPTAITVRWRTSTSENSEVRVGLTPTSLTMSFVLPANATEHIVPVSGLNPDTRYYYSIGSTATVLAGGNLAHTFVTSPLTGVQKPTRIWVVGDAGTADANQRAVRDAYLTYAAGRSTDLFLMLGDNAYNSGTDAEYQAAVFNIYPTVLRSTVAWSTYGNHDGFSADSGTQTGVYYDVFTFPRNAEAGGVMSGTEAYYSFDYGNIHFICLDSFESDRTVPSPMLNWMNLDLAATTADWVIAFWHHPPYSNGTHNSDTENELREMRADAVRLLEAAGVDLVLGGHSHVYERSFLIDGHYGLRATFNPAINGIDMGNGRVGGNGAYMKAAGGPAPRAGVVYTVAGSSGKVDPVATMPAMFTSQSRLGSVVLEVACGRLDAKFIDQAGIVRDYYSVFKGAVGPVGPNTLTIGTVTATRIDLMWVDVADNETGFAIERSQDGFVYTNIGTAPANATSYSDTTVIGGTDYWYRVRAINANCQALWSNIVMTTSGPPACGNGATEAGEQCDDSGESPTCDADCTFAQCGDGTVNSSAGELCDHSGESATCNADCTLAACGDGVLNTTAGEVCDDGGESATCDLDCTPAMCGDGLTNTTAGELCDTAGESTSCDADCTLALCGDGTVNTTAGELCDTAGESTSCDADCTLALCGDGTVNTTAGELCDTAGESTSCDADCTLALCGDGTVNTTAGELCDSAGESTSCDADCTLVICGDGTLNTTAGESCDDGNVIGGDGCDATCQIETCLVASLQRVRLVLAVRTALDVSLSWQPDPGSSLYHVNSVATKVELLDPRRTPGNGLAECDAVTLDCTDSNAPLTGVLFYQVLSACDVAQEGPF